MTNEEWEKPWLRNSNYGFYAWPESLEVSIFFFIQNALLVFCIMNKQSSILVVLSIVFYTLTL